jgi:hypothetical protein
MAYAGFALYLTAFAAGLISPRWPPSWNCSSPGVRFLLSFAVATMGWLTALGFVGWQLLRRRLAAIRVAATEKLLTRWLTESPRDTDLQPWQYDSPDQSRALRRKWWHFFWPPAAPVPEGDVKDGGFPSVLVAAWRAQESWPGTQARTHETGIILVGWLLWLALVIKTALVLF